MLQCLALRICDILFRLCFVLKRLLGVNCVMQGSLEMFSGLGLMLGPPLGGVLYEVIFYHVALANTHLLHLTVLVDYISCIHVRLCVHK